MLVRRRLKIISSYTFKIIRLSINILTMLYCWSIVAVYKCTCSYVLLLYRHTCEAICKIACLLLPQLLATKKVPNMIIAISMSKQNGIDHKLYPYIRQWKVVSKALMRRCYSEDNNDKNSQIKCMYCQIWKCILHVA